LQAEAEKNKATITELSKKLDDSEAKMHSMKKEKLTLQEQLKKKIESYANIEHSLVQARQEIVD
jgi:hypothetical protein